LFPCHLIVCVPGLLECDDKKCNFTDEAAIVGILPNWAAFQTFNTLLSGNPWFTRT